MSITDKNPEWFTSEIEANQAYIAGIEKSAAERKRDGFPTYSTYLPRHDPKLFDKFMYVIINAGWELASITPGTSAESVFVVFTRRHPARFVDSVEDMEGRR